MSGAIAASWGEFGGDGIRRLHRGSVQGSNRVSQLLRQARVSRIMLSNGIDRANRVRSAVVDAVSEEGVDLITANVPQSDSRLYFSFELDHERYFFVATPQRFDSARMRIDLPSSIYRAERRDLARMAPADGDLVPRTVELVGEHRTYGTAEVLDYSYQGLGLAIGIGEAPSEQVTVEFVDGPRSGETTYGKVCSSVVAQDRDGRMRLGLFTSAVPSGPPVRPQVLSAIHVPSRRDRIAVGVQAMAAVAGAAMPESIRALRRRRRAPMLSVVRYPNNRGEQITGLVDQVGERGGPVVVIPPSWGRTKETFLPLARTIAHTFAENDEPIAILRYDGTHRRGESHVDIRFRGDSDEYLGFTFSQAASDLETSISFAAQSLGAPVGKVVVVTFSLGSVEGRRAIARDRLGLVGGWVSVVGMVDLQSGLRAVSGGIDYAYGINRGVEFGVHELVGVRADMDLTGADALRSRLVYNEDARRDMAEIDVPITWIHGRHDAWIDRDRVRGLLEAGDPAGRRLLEVPTGHQLRSSREALSTFRLIAEEVSHMALGRRLPARTPPLGDLDSRLQAERQRRPPIQIELRDFWRDYVIGRDRTLGIELMTSTSSYRKLMDAQIDLLALRGGERMLDLGAGAGDFAHALSRRGGQLPGWLCEIDLVTDALHRSAKRDRVGELVAARIAADLDGTTAGFPLSSSTFDTVLASLLICYVRHPRSFLERVHGCLRPGGRLVLSTLRRDADISRLYVEGMAELPPERVVELFGPSIAGRFHELQREFLNGASKLLDLEELGVFRFFDRDELERLVRASGFDVVDCGLEFGTPPQAIVLSAVRR